MTFTEMRARAAEIAADADGLPIDQPLLLALLTHAIATGFLLGTTNATSRMQEIFTQGAEARALAARSIELDDEIPEGRA